MGRPSRADSFIPATNTIKINDHKHDFPLSALEQGQCTKYWCKSHELLQWQKNRACKDAPNVFANPASNRKNMHTRARCLFCQIYTRFLFNGDNSSLCNSVTNGIKESKARHAVSSWRLCWTNNNELDLMTWNLPRINFFANWFKPWCVRMR